MVEGANAVENFFSDPINKKLFQNQDYVNGLIGGLSIKTGPQSFSVFPTDKLLTSFDQGVRAGVELKNQMSVADRFGLLGQGSTPLEIAVLKSDSSYEMIEILVKAKIEDGKPKLASRGPYHTVNTTAVEVYEPLNPDVNGWRGNRKALTAAVPRNEIKTP